MSGFRIELLTTMLVCAKSLQSCQTLCNPTDCSLAVSSVHRFSRQEYWSGLPSASPGDLPIPGIKPMFLTSPALAGRFFINSSNARESLSNYSFFFFLMYIKCETLQECNTFLNQSRRKQVMKLKNCLKNTSK